MSYLRVLNAAAAGDVLPQCALCHDSAKAICEGLGLCRLWRRLSGASVAQELQKVCIETHSVLILVGTLLLRFALLEENSEARESIEALRAEVGQLAASHERMSHVREVLQVAPGGIVRPR